MDGRERTGVLRGRLAALAVGAILVVGVAACSSDSGGGDSTTTTKPAETTETTAATGAEGASETTDDSTAVKNAPLNNCVNVQSGQRPTTPEAQAALRQSQQQCQQQQRPTTLPPRVR